MKFFKTPFVFIVPLFCLGILFGESEVFFMLVSVATVLISLILLFLYFFRRSFQTLFLPFAIVSIVLLGILSFKGSVWSNGRLVDEYGGAEASILVDVVEISNSNKEWRKAVCNVIATIDEKELVPRSERIVIYFNSEVVEVRDRLLIVSRLFPIRNKGNLGEFDQETYWKFKGVTAMAFINDFDLFFLSKQKATLFDQSRELISAYLNSVLENHLSKNNQAIARALILGDKSQLDPEVKKSFSSAGAMHVLAVSGLHVGIILEIFLFLFGRFPKLVSKQVALIISLLLIWGYAGVIGFPASVVRASLMFSILVLGRQFSRDSNGLNTLLFSCFLMLCIDPMWLFDLGFQLSFFAMMGIILLSKPLTQTFYIRNKIILRLWEGTCVGLSAQLFTLPITLYYFHQFPNYFLITNVGMMIFAGGVLGLGLLLFVTHWGGGLGVFVGMLLGGMLTAMVLFVQYIEDLPGAVSLGFSIPFWLLISAYVILFSFLLFKKIKWVLLISLSMSFLLLTFAQIERYRAIMSQEITAFNFNKLVVGFKDKDKLIVMHDVNTDEQLKKLKYIIEAYQKVQPCEAAYCKLGDGCSTIVFEDYSFNMKRWENGFLLTNETTGKEMFFRVGLGDVPIIREDVIDMPYHGSNIFDRNLVFGSISIRFSD